MQIFAYAIDLTLRGTFANFRARPDEQRRPRGQHEQPAGQRKRRSRLAAEQMARPEEHTSELQSLMRTSYAVFCLKKKPNTQQHALKSKPITSSHHAYCKK